MKKNILLTIVFAFSLLTGLSAQQSNRTPEDRKAAFEKIKAEHVQFINSQLNLTAEEAAAFWPICDELHQKKFALNKELRDEFKKMFQAEKEGKKISDADYSRIINMSADLKVQEAELDKVYLKKFSEVIPPQKVFKYQRAEQQFAKKMLDARDARGGKN